MIQSAIVVSGRRQEDDSEITVESMRTWKVRDSANADVEALILKKIPSKNNLTQLGMSSSVRWRFAEVNETSANSLWM